MITTKESFLIDLKALDNLDISQFNQVYFGKQGCACGCNGNYHESSRMFKSALTKLKNKCIECEPIEVFQGDGEDKSIICWEGEERAIRIYTKEIIEI